MAEEKIYTVPLRKGFLKAPGYDRSRKAKVTLKEILEEYADNLGKRAWEIAKHSKRKTVKSGDLKLATK